MNSYLVYDLEILRAIPDSKNLPMQGIEYCDGWGDHANMGISVIGAYDNKENRFRTFCKDNFSEFQELLSTRFPLITFNGINFDDRVLTANGFQVPEGKSLDLLQEIWKAAGLGPTFEYPSHAGYSLNAVCRANNLPVKTSNGVKAPIDWQQGKIGTVIDYCLNDVKITHALFSLMFFCRKLTNPKDNSILEFHLPDF
jgi:hypothetical protein